MNAKKLFESEDGERFKKRFNDARFIAESMGHTINPLEEWDEWQPNLFRGYCVKCGDNVTVDISGKSSKDLDGFALMPVTCKGYPHKPG